MKVSHHSAVVYEPYVALRLKYCEPYFALSEIRLQIYFLVKLSND